MDNENLPVKKEKKSNILKRGLSAFLAFIGISSFGYQQAKTVEDYKEDYNTNPGYTEKAMENIDAKYDNAFEKMGVTLEKIEDIDVDKDKLVEIADVDSEKDKLVEIEDIDAEKDKLVEIEDRYGDNDNPMLEELRDKVNTDDVLQYIKDKNADDKLVEIEDREI